jgi:CelD/BcsL family acetyltransferase involved in cellulose biosynthesis
VVEVVWMKDSDFQKMSDIWNRVLEKSRSNNIFLTWEWISTWWKHFGEGRKLLVLLLKKDGRIIGIVPLMYAQKKMNLVSLGMIEFIGVGLADYSDLILTEEEEDCINAIFDFLERLHLEWDVMDLRHIPGNSDTANMIQRVGRKRGYPIVRKETICQYVPLDRSWEEYYRTLSAKMRKNLSSSLRKCNTICMKHIEDAKDLKDSMQDFFNIYAKWLGQRHDDVPLDNLDGFLIDLAYAFLERGWLNLSFILLDKRPISSHFSFIYDNVFYSYQTPWDESYSNYDIGNLHNMFLLEYSMKNGLKKFDFLRGDEPYKARWKTLRQNNVRILLLRKTIKGRLIRFLLGPIVKGIREAKLR